MRSSDLSDVLMHQYNTCSRCGRHYLLCPHSNTHHHDISPEHAKRIQTAYAFGKRFNPDHDETDYYEMTADKTLKGGAYDQPDPETAEHPDTAVGSRVPLAPEPKDLQNGH